MSAIRVGVLLLVLGACSKSEKDSAAEQAKVAEYAAACKASKFCKENGNCAYKPRYVPMGGELEKFDAMLHCIAASESDCAASPGCQLMGACGIGALDGRCAPTKPEHCAETSVCKTMGFCDVVGSMCGPTRVEHCAQASACKLGGRKCSYADGRCID